MAEISPQEIGRFERVKLLQLVKEDNVYQWQAVQGVWAEFKADGGKNLFSANGIGARNATFILRRFNGITLFNAFKYNGKHYFLTLIENLDRMYRKVTAAEIEPTICSYTPKVYSKDEYNRPTEIEGEEIIFPACITEKFVGYTQTAVTAKTEVTFVFVTPKEIVLFVGDEIVADGKTYQIEKVHLLDEYKNEYEATVKGDV
ncbi:MAG: hypothetical protein VB018_13270 [Lachnospiraceae bacterium]|nr:hypothetical protein [Lachnospiraceae bacterium]